MKMMADGWCDVWWRAVQIPTEGAVALLDEPEQRRFVAFRKPADRNRFLTAAVLLRRTVSACTGIPAGRIIVDRTCPICGSTHGRPTLPGLGLHVSISHSGGQVGVALTELGPVGLDVEQVRDVDIEALAGQFLHADERPDGRPEFFRCWTRKEAVVKATGDGVVLDLRHVRIAGPRRAPSLREYPGRPGLAAVLRDLHPAEGYAAALAVLTEGRLSVREHAS
jgi:4'-phosphopantetheinyl transferase